MSILLLSCNDQVPYKKQIKGERVYPAHDSVQGRYDWELLVTVAVGLRGCLFISRWYMRQRRGGKQELAPK